jgi:hypothetical protein
MNEDVATIPREDPRADGASSESIGALPFPRMTSANDPTGEVPNTRPEAGDWPSDDDGMKRSQLSRSSLAPPEGVSDGEKAVALGLRMT